MCAIAMRRSWGWGWGLGVRGSGCRGARLLASACTASYRARERAHTYDNLQPAVCYVLCLLRHAWACAHVHVPVPGVSMMPVPARAYIYGGE